MKKIAIAAILFCLALSATAQEDTLGFTPEIGSCRYYRTLSDELGCGPDGYLRAFGERFCREFKARRFSPEGEKILAEIRLCLQLELEKRRSRLTCGSVKAIASASHATCYQRHRFCRLSWADKAIVIQVVLPALADAEILASLGDIDVFCDPPFSE